MTAEIISVGTELLLGNILNTNAQYLSRELADLGITVQRESTIGDNHDRLADFVNEAKSRCDLLVFTGPKRPSPPASATSWSSMRPSGRRSPATLPAPAVRRPPTTASRRWCQSGAIRSSTTMGLRPVHGSSRMAAVLSSCPACPTR